jgi:hypothetical protein
MFGFRNAWVSTVGAKFALAEGIEETFMLCSTCLSFSFGNRLMLMLDPSCEEEFTQGSREEVLVQDLKSVSSGSDYPDIKAQEEACFEKMAIPDYKHVISGLLGKRHDVFAPNGEPQSRKGKNLRNLRRHKIAPSCCMDFESVLVVGEEKLMLG